MSCPEPDASGLPPDADSLQQLATRLADRETSAGERLEAAGELSVLLEEYGRLEWSAANPKLNVLLGLIPGLRDAFHAETAGDYLAQAWALMKRQFREGPHEHLGQVRALRIGSTEGSPFGLLVDGEEAPADAELEVVLAHCDVDLVATEIDD